MSLDAVGKAGGRVVRQYLLLWLFCLLGALCGRYFLDVAGVYAIDDAYIFFVYAQNLIDGQGFVYNPGGERVEGFSSFAWLMLLVPTLWLNPAADPGIAVLLLTGALAALSLQYVWQALEELGAQMIATHGYRFSSLLVLGAAWIASSPGWLLWVGASGMDLALWGCLLSCFIWLFVRMVMRNSMKTGGLAVALGLLMVVRPEAPGWALFFILSIAIYARVWGLSVRRLVTGPLIAAVGSYSALTVFRLGYFGYPLPNTYYAKVSRDWVYNLQEGGAYLFDYLTGNGFASVAVLLAVWVCVRELPYLYRALIAGDQGGDKLRFISVFLGWAILFALLTMLLVGGDHFGGFRLLQPIYPLIFLFVAVMWMRRTDAVVSPNLSVLQACIAVVAGAVLLTLPVRAAWYNVDRTGLKTEFDVAAEGQAAAAALSSIIDSAGIDDVPVVAITGAGGFKWAWPGAIFDLMGLNDVEMAHSPGDRIGFKGHAAFDREIFLARRPAVLMPHIEGWPLVLDDCRNLSKPEHFYWQVLDGMQADAEFAALYSLTESTGQAGLLCMYVRNDYLNLLQAAPGTEWQVLDGS